MQIQNSNPKAVQIAFALKGGKLVHISTVDKGLACGCICPKCNDRLKARKGLKRKHHFAHLPGSNCAGAAETILHKIAKEVIARLDWILIPEYHYRRKKLLSDGRLITQETIIAKGGNVRIDKVEIERSFGSIRPDVVVFLDDKPLVIEIAVTHKSERKKKRIFRKYDIPAIEIRLSESHAMLDQNTLQELIQTDTSTKHWLFHPSQIAEDQDFLAKARDGLAQIRKSRSHRIDISPIVKYEKNASRFDYGYVNDAERIGEAFRKKHGRYPTIAEMLTNWPSLFRPKSK